jgi:hypothetical protein
MNNANNSKSIEGGCVRPMLIDEARAAGKRWRNAVRRGDVSAACAFDNSGVGYPYMTAAEYSAAKSAFVGACR